MLAAERAHVSTARQPRARGDVNPDKQDVHGQTPMSCALEDGHESLMPLLQLRRDALAMGVWRWGILVANPRKSTGVAPSPNLSILACSDTCLLGFGSAWLRPRTLCRFYFPSSFVSSGYCVCETMSRSDLCVASNPIALMGLFHVMGTDILWLTSYFWLGL